MHRERNLHAMKFNNQLNRGGGGASIRKVLFQISRFVSKFALNIKVNLQQFQARFYINNFYQKIFC